MCGIVGYIGKDKGIKTVLNGLEILEYRGYDSAGIAFLEGNKNTKTQTIKSVKSIGRVEELIKAAGNETKSSDLAIGHTRWATHGNVTVENAHPHANADQTIFVVHNGIIENYQEIKDKLVKNGYNFISQTDTEVIPHLIDYYYKNLKKFEDAFNAAISDLIGAYSVVSITSFEPGKMYVARLSSPLIIGVGKNENFVASDHNAVSTQTKQVIYLEDYDTAVITKDSVKLKNLKKDKPSKPKVELITEEDIQASLGDFEDFMSKEIWETPAAIKSASLGRALPDQNLVKLGGLENVSNQLKLIDRIVIVSMGTSYYAGLVGEYLLEEIAGIPVEVQLSSEFNYRNQPLSRGTALLAISQSGETADTINALKKVEDSGILRLGIVNAVGSTVSRITDSGVYCHAGPEKAVASTKAFVAQVTVLALMALYLSPGSSERFKPLLKEINELPDKANHLLENASEIKKLAHKYSKYTDFMFIGRQNSYASALEGALKLKEISYIHAEGYSSGEMKHGPIAMIDKSFPTVAIATDGILLDKTYSNIQEIKARGGPILAVATVGNKKIKKLADDVIYIPKTEPELQPILEVICLQLFSYYVAKELGHNIDRPRNLAKSVTVE